MVSKTNSQTWDSEQTSCFLIEKEGRLIVAMAVAEYDEGLGGGAEDARRMFAQGRRTGPLAAVEVAGAGHSLWATRKPTPKSKPRPKPRTPKTPPPAPPPPPPPPPSPTPGIGTESPGIGTNVPGIGTNP